MAPYASSSSPHPPIPPAANLSKPQPFEFGESVFLKRRAEWLALPAPSSSSSRSPPGGKNDSAKRLKPLKTLMDEVGDGEVPEAVWKGALSDVHRGLMGGRSESLRLLRSWLVPLAASADASTASRLVLS